MRRWLLPALACALMQAGAADAADAPPGATSCTGCHAMSKTVETPVAMLNGRRPIEIVAAMREFKSGARPNTVMGRIAKGFSDPETEAIAAWFGAQAN
jgi:sulfide dehydrogenase cytochrome subunit